MKFLRDKLTNEYYYVKGKHLSLKRFVLNFKEYNIDDKFLNVFYEFYLFVDDIIVDENIIVNLKEYL